MGQPLPELVLHNRSPTTLTVRELEHELITRTIAGAPESHDLVEGGHRSVGRPRTGGEGDFVGSLLKLDGLLKNDCDDGTLLENSSDPSPGELSHGVTLSWAGGNEG